jgi:hypothetical protein
MLKHCTIDVQVPLICTMKHAGVLARVEVTLLRLDLRAGRFSLIDENAPESERFQEIPGNLPFSGGAFRGPGGGAATMYIHGCDIIVPGSEGAYPTWVWRSTVSYSAEAGTNLPLPLTPIILQHGP